FYSYHYTIFFYETLSHLNVHSFPTRRSSDLHVSAGPAAGADHIDEDRPDHRGDDGAQHGVGVVGFRMGPGPHEPAHRHTGQGDRSEEHTSELQSRFDLV